jgi:hypothetical protein
MAENAESDAKEAAALASLEKRVADLEGMFQNLQGAGDIQVAGGVISYTGGAQDPRSGERAKG